MKITLKIYEGESEKHSQELSEGKFVLGRGERCDVLLENESVSRSHAELRISESSVYLQNLSTSGKVYVNRQAVETVELSAGDQFDIGPYRIVVLFGTQADAKAVVGMDEPAPTPDVPSEEEGGEGFKPLDGGLGDDPSPLDNAGDGDEGALPGFEGFGELGDGGGQEDPADPDPVPEPEPAPAAPLESAPLSASSESEGAGFAGGETKVQQKPLVAKLIFTEGPRAGEELFLETYEVTFGRSKRADIYVDDDKLSRVHAKITRVGMGYRLVDLSSRNGTYVNGMRVLEHPLSSFDVISLGRSKIKFLIHDIMLQEQGAVGTGAVAPTEQTHSVQLTPSREAQIVQLQKEAPPPAKAPNLPNAKAKLFGLKVPRLGKNTKTTPLTKLLVVALLALGLVFIFSPDEKTTKKQAAPTKEAQVNQGKQAAPSKNKVLAPPTMPQEYFELSPEKQRALEGNYRSALRAAENQQFDEAVFHISKIHELVPYYKNSRELAEKYDRKLKEVQVAQAEAKAKQDEKQDLQIYLEEGLDYLRLGDFERAAESFNSAIVVDPTNAMAKQGLRAAELKVRDIKALPPEVDPEADKRKKIIALFQKAVAAFANKGYSEAIETAEEIRKIELSGDTQYLSEAKQIIDRARVAQKEEFEPFLIQAKEKYAEADYNASRDLCEEMVKRDPAYDDASECLKKAKRQLNRLAKEAYTHGYILESMNKIDEAKQYWLRAKNYVRKGDPYYEKVNKKLDYYQ